MTRDSASLISASCQCLKQVCTGLDLMITNVEWHLEDEGLPPPDKHSFLTYLMTDTFLPKRFLDLLNTALNPDLLSQLSKLLISLFNLLLEHAEDEFLAGPYQTPEFSAAVTGALVTSMNEGSTTFRFVECLGQLRGLPSSSKEQATATCDALATYIRTHCMDNSCSVCLTVRLCKECWGVLGGVHQESAAALLAFVEGAAGVEEMREAVERVQEVIMSESDK